MAGCLCQAAHLSLSNFVSIINAAGQNLRNGWITPQLQGNHYTNLIISEEEQTRQSQAGSDQRCFSRSSAKLDGNTTNTTLYYKEGLTQQQIALQLQMKQYTARRLTKSRETLQALAQWSQQTLHISQLKRT